MPRMSNRDKEELAFFLNDRGRVAYAQLCRKRKRECKQSFRATIIACPAYLSKRRKKNDQ